MPRWSWTVMVTNSPLPVSDHEAFLVYGTSLIISRLKVLFVIDKIDTICLTSYAAKEEELGRVPSFAEIETMQIPSLCYIQSVIGHTRTVLSSSDGVEAALFFGSAVSGQLTLLSDIDVVVIYPEERVESYFGTVHRIRRYAQSHGVPLQLRPVEAACGRCGAHSLDLGLVRHLKRSAERGGVIKGDVFAWLSSGSEADFRHDVIGYLRRKLEKLTELLPQYSCLNHEQRFDLLHEILDTPMHAARKLLELGGADLSNDSRSAVLQLATVHDRHVGCLTEVEQVYQSFGLAFKIQYNVQPDRHIYESELERIYRAGSTARSYLAASLADLVR